ncbi:MAG: TadE family protein [Acidimicrobiales bacterium]
MSPVAAASVASGTDVGAGRTEGRRRGRGAAALEMALLVPVLTVMLFGIVDVGDLLVRQGAAASSVRIAAVESFDRAGERSHDLDVASTLVTEMRNRGLPDVKRIVIYDATTADQPPASCLSGAALVAGGVAGVCVVFGPTDLASIAAGSAAARFDDPDCFGDADAQWCATTRLPANPLDGWRVGIWVEAGHQSPTGVLPNLRNYDIEENAVVHLWERTASL